MKLRSDTCLKPWGSSFYRLSLLVPPDSTNLYHIPMSKVPCAHGAQVTAVWVESHTFLLSPSSIPSSSQTGCSHWPGTWYSRKVADIQLRYQYKLSGYIQDEIAFTKDNSIQFKTGKICEKREGGCLRANSNSNMEDRLKFYSLLRGNWSSIPGCAINTEKFVAA